MANTLDRFFSKGTLHLSLARRVSSDVWDSLGEEDKLIPKGSIVVDMSEMHGDDAAILLLPPDRIGDLIDRQVAQAYLVVGHSQTDGTPECLRMGDPNDPLVPVDLPLVPFKL